MIIKPSSDQTTGVSLLNEQAHEALGSNRLVAYRRFLVPIDFSDHSNKTIQHATHLAALTGASIHLLHVFQIPDYSAAFYQGLYVEHEAVKIYVETAKCKALGQLSLLAEQIHAKGMVAESILRIGNPYEEIVSAAKQIGADLIVIGSHGYTGLGRLLLGSTADRVLHFAPCPVLVVNDPSVYQR